MLQAFLGLLLHTDAAQSVSKISTDVSALGVLDLTVGTPAGRPAMGERASSRCRMPGTYVLEP